MNLSAILAECYRSMRYTTAPPAAITTRLTASINIAQREILTIPDLQRLRDATMPVTAFANYARTGLTPSIARILAITDRTNFFKLQQVPLAELRLEDPAQASTGGYPLRYAVVGKVATQLPIAASTGSGLWVSSSAAADVTGPQALVESILYGGYQNTPGTTGTILTGTTRAAIGTRTDHQDVTRFYLQTQAAGFVSLWDAATAGNELARLAIGDTFSSYLAIEWWPIPTANVTEQVDYTRVITDLVNPNDEALVPDDFGYLLAIGARRKEYELLSDSRFAEADLEWARGIKDLRNWVMNDGDRMVSLRPISVGSNLLGPNYPASGNY